MSDPVDLDDSFDVTALLVHSVHLALFTNLFVQLVRKNVVDAGKLIASLEDSATDQEDADTSKAIRAIARGLRQGIAEGGLSSDS